MPNKTLSKRKRITYLTICVLAFIILSPLIAYYATGYRFGEKFEVTKTGGIYVVIEGKGFSILLNGAPQEISSIFRRNFFIQNLAPAVYSIRVDKEGYHSWGKRISVDSEKVADVYPFNLPDQVDLIEIPKKISLEDEDNSVDSKSVATATVQSKATSTLLKKEIDNEEYVAVKALFATSSERLVTPKVTASTTKSDPKQIISYKKIALWYQEDKIFVKWQGSEDSAPLYFCNLETCLDKLEIFSGVKINNVDLLSDKQQFVIFSTDNGIYVTEIDGRGGRNIESLLIGEGYDFRIASDQTLYIKKGKTYYRADLSV